MRQSLRETIILIRKMGGKNVAVTQGGRHTAILFTNESGKRQRLSIHRGCNELTYVAGRNRSNLRRLMTDQKDLTKELGEFEK
jgi:hypothetical protein